MEVVWDSKEFHTTSMFFRYFYKDCGFLLKKYPGGNFRKNFLKNTPVGSRLIDSRDEVDMIIPKTGLNRLERKIKASRRFVPIFSSQNLQFV